MAANRKKSDAEQAFEAGMRELAAALRVDLSQETMVAYWHTLGKYSSTQLRSAFGHMRDTQQFFPPPSVIRSRIDTENKERALPPAMPPVEPWTKEQRQEAQEFMRRLNREMSFQRNGVGR